MGKVLLFDTIKRKYFNELDEKKKKTRNYIIKEEDGTVSKYISQLEGSGGGGGSEELVVTYIDGEIEGKLISDTSLDDIIDAYESGKSVKARYYAYTFYCIQVESFAQGAESEHAKFVILDRGWGITIDQESGLSADLSILEFITRT
jgi:hypothetical protein